MPLDPGTAAGISGGASLLGSAINAGSTARQNKLNRRWQEKMFNWQRDAALTDWGLQNAYNHPLEQMKRLREAGLSPHLVYGNGATTEAGTIRSQNPGSYQGDAPQLDLGGAAGSALAAYYDAQMKPVQVENMQAQTQIYEAEKLLKAAQIINTQANTEKTLSDTRMSNFDLSLKNTLRDINVKAAELANEKTIADTKMTLDENERRAAMQQPTLQKAAEEILNLRMSRAKTSAEISHIRQQIENLKQDYRIKRFDEEVQSKGIPRNSPAWMRILSNMLENVEAEERKKREEADQSWRDYESRQKPYFRKK